MGKIIYKLLGSGTFMFLATSELVDAYDAYMERRKSRRNVTFVTDGEGQMIKASS